MLSGTVAQSFSDNNGICLCTSDFVDDIIFPTMDPTVLGVGNNDVSAVLKQVVKIFNVFATGCHAVGLCRHTTAANCEPGAKLMSTIAL